MTTAEQISQFIIDLQAQGKPLSEIAWTAAKACLGWAYVFGALLGIFAIALVSAGRDDHDP